jgi:hypothetical protein
MLAALLTDSPMWLPWAVYWAGWAVAHAVWWWVTTTTRNLEAIAPLASVVYWVAVAWLWGAVGWAWTRTKNVYGLREAVDLGDDAQKLGKLTRTVIRGQTKLRTQAAATSLVATSTALVGLLALGIMGAWSLLLGVLVPSVWWVRRLNGARWE